jgi:hypothetical protein
MAYEYTMPDHGSPSVERKSSLMVDADVVGGKDNVSSWRRIFEKLIVTQLVKNLSTFCGA